MDDFPSVLSARLPMTSVRLATAAAVDGRIRHTVLHTCLCTCLFTYPYIGGELDAALDSLPHDIDMLVSSSGLLVYRHVHRHVYRYVCSLARHVSRHA